MNKLRCAAAVTAILVAATAQADCVDTVGPSAAEQQFLERAQAALKVHLRPAAEGAGVRWTDGSGAEGLVTTCKGSARKVGDFSPTVRRKFIWPDLQKNRADATVELVLTVNAPALPAADAGGAAGVASPQRSAGLAVHNVTWVAKTGGWGLRSQEEQLRAAVASAAPFSVAAVPADADTERASSTAVTTTHPGAGGAAAGTAPVAQQSPPASTATRGAVAAATETVDRAKDAAQKLKGLFGR